MPVITKQGQVIDLTKHGQVVVLTKRGWVVRPYQERSRATMLLYGYRVMLSIYYKKMDDIQLVI